MSFPEYLRASRAALNVSRQEVAVAAGVSHSWIVQIERGVQPSTESATKIRTAIERLVSDRLTALQGFTRASA